jgi:Bacterial Ig-like domain (group 2)
MLVGARFLYVLALLCSSCCFGQSVLSLSSASGEPGGPVTLNISFDTAYPGKSAALQWTLNSPAGEVASFNVVAGPAAESAQKSLYCVDQTCLLAGINSYPLGNGVIATVTLNLSSTATGNLVVQLSNPVEALLDGTGGSIMAANGIVNVAGLSVTVAPAFASLYGAQSLQLSATVTGTSDSNVTWTINPQMGTLSSSGLYTAPPTISAPQTILVTATSTANPTESGSVDLYLLPPVAVTLSPSTITLEPWQKLQFTANVGNASNSAVTWSLNPVLGSISNGEYTAPRSITKPQSVTVTATSVVDPTQTATAVITLVPFPLRGHRKFPPRP